MDRRTYILFENYLSVKLEKLYKKASLLGASVLLALFAHAQDTAARKSVTPTNTTSDTPTNINVLDSMISVTIVLFILSVITEKLTQLIRKYSPFIRPGDNLYGKSISRVWRNVRKRQIDGTRMDDKIEREVNSLSFMIGLLISIVFCVDIFQLFFADDPRKHLYWTTERWVFYWAEDVWAYRVSALLISFCLTAFFLTFGSKFFHDLLDSLLQTKNLKRKLVDENTYAPETIERFDEYLDKTYSDLIQMAINQNRNVLRTSEAVSPCMHGRMRHEGKLIDCIDVHLRGNNRSGLPQAVPVKFDSGRTVMVRVNVIMEVEKPTVSVLQGDTTANKDTGSFKGTICCKVMKDGQEALLTCSHVLTGGTSYNLLGSITPKPAQIDGDDNGNFVYALCTDEFDVALLSSVSGNFTYRINPQKERRPTLTDILHTKVRVVCCNNVVKTGVVVNDRVLEPMEIEYKGKTAHSLINLIVLSNVTEAGGEPVYEKVTVPGDSGACVYDESDRPIGMIVAGSNKFSYAIPIVSILNKLSATIIK